MQEGDKKSPAQKKEFSAVLGGVKKSFKILSSDLTPSSTLRKSKTTAEELAKKQEDTRSTISMIFIIAYFVIIATLIIFTTFFQLKAEAAKDYLLAIGSPLGFIIGYYFKSDSKD
jgi:hypothetical protein